MPAAAVIPAPIAYIKVVAVKKLVVGSRVFGRAVVPLGCALPGPDLSAGLPLVLFAECLGRPERLL